jgi:LAO/AO transport system kinase
MSVGGAGGPAAGAEARALAKALSAVERGGDAAAAVVAGVRGQIGHARTVGVTGAPGVGKSTFVQALGVTLIERRQSVAVLATDPSSPFSGGALLGDRVRMAELLARGGFVRSIATRGALGGIAAATSDAVDVLDAAGFDWVLVETIGAGQDEVDVALEVETVLVLTVGGLGDDVQAAKAGLMEIGDIFVVNKADLTGAGAQAATLEAALALAPPSPWRPPVIETTATRGDGVVAVADAVKAHQAFLDLGRRSELRARRTRRRVERLLAGMVLERARAAHAAEWERVMADACSGALDPYAAAARLAALSFGGQA